MRRGIGCKQRHREMKGFNLLGMYSGIHTSRQAGGNLDKKADIQWDREATQLIRCTDRQETKQTDRQVAFLAYICSGAGR